MIVERFLNRPIKFFYTNLGKKVLINLIQGRSTLKNSEIGQNMAT